jgi:hypothetical protein
MLRQGFVKATPRLRKGSAPSQAWLGSVLYALAHETAALEERKFLTFGLKSTAFLYLGKKPARGRNFSRRFFRCRGQGLCIRCRYANQENGDRRKNCDAKHMIPVALVFMPVRPTSTGEK